MRIAVLGAGGAGGYFGGRWAQAGLRLGAERGVDTPVNREIYQTLLPLEREALAR